MATQNRTTKPQLPQGSAAARQAAQAPAADAAKLARQAADKAELDKLAQASQAEAVKEVVAETAAEGSAAAADAAAAAEGSLGAVSGEVAAGAAAEAGAAGAAGAGAAGTVAAVSPLAIGAGVVGVAAVAAAAGGGSSGGSSSQPIAQNPDSNQSSNQGSNQSSQNQGGQTTPTTPANEQPAEPAKEGDKEPAKDSGKEPSKEDDPAKQPDQKPAEQPKVEPVEDLTKPATAGGTATEPKVAADGVTNLTKFAELFDTAGANGGKAQFIKITRILSAEGKEADARVVDYDNSHAYEVIDAGKPITLAEAETMAKQLGGKLMTIDSAEEKAWLDKNLFGTLGTYDGDKSLAEAEAKGESDKAAQQKVLDGQLAANGAWLGKDATVGADAKTNAVIRNGDGKDTPAAMKLYEPAGTTLTKFVIEYDNYQSPLLLGNKPVVEGDIINKADAAKLAWNASQSKIGQISFQAVDSDDADKAKVVADSQAGTIKLAESAEVKHPMVTPTTPTNPDKPAPGGEDPTNNGQQDNQNGQDSNQQGGNQDGQNNGQKPAPAEQPATAQGTAEAPQVATTGETKLAKAAELFAKAGANGAAADYIKITHIYSAEGSNAEARVVRYEDAQSTTQKKDVTGEAKVTTHVATAYEVIDAGKPITRTEAEQMAEKLGGKLLSIDDAEEAKWLTENLIGKIGQQGEANDNSAAAWMNSKVDANANAVIRTGDGEAYKFAQVNVGEEKLSHFVIEYGNYKSPLLLNGQPIAEGTIISKEDFDKLSWNADQSTTGKISYVAVTGDGEDAKEVEGATPASMELTESAAVTHPTTPAPVQPKPENPANPKPENPVEPKPVNPADPKPENPTNDGDQDGKQPVQPKLPTYPDSQKLDIDTHDAPSTSVKAELFLGNGADKAAAVKITEVPGGALKKGADVVKQGDVIKAEDFGKLTWDASKAEGGTIKFKPVTADEKDIAGAQEQTITVNEPAAPPQPKPVPSYEADKSVNVAHDEANAKIDKSVFEGTNPANKPLAVKATGFAQGTLKVNGVAINDGDRINAEDFDKVTWDASKAEGGSFKFTPVMANGDALTGATEQTVTIKEAPAAPETPAAPKVGEYSAEKTVVPVGRDAEPFKLDAKIFAGNDAEKAPDAVKITMVHGPDNQPTNDGVLTYTVGNQKHSLTSGSYLDKANFDNVEWDAKADAHNAGTYKVQFKPVTADHKEIESAAEQKFDVKEDSGVPTYEASKLTLNVETHDGKQMVPEALFKGENAATAPLYVWIKGSTETDGASDGHVFMRLADGSNGGLGKDLTTNGTENGSGEVISWSDLGKVQWDAAHNSGGTIRFRPLDGDRQEIGEWQTITVTEAEAGAPQTPGPQEASGGSQEQSLGFDQVFHQQGSALKSVAAYTPTEPASNPLDELHNQITPLI